MQGLHFIPYYHAVPVALQFCCLSPVCLCLMNALANPTWVTRYYLLAKKSMEQDSVESLKDGAKWSPHSQGARGQCGLHGLCTAATPKQLGNRVPSSHLALSSGIGWPLMLTWDMWVGLFIPAGHNPGALLGANT